MNSENNLSDTLWCACILLTKSFVWLFVLAVLFGSWNAVINFLPFLFFWLLAMGLFAGIRLLSWILS
ncbi:MAG: hypothetical protein KGV56_02505 [Gammaproteobacteria bacterium]|nr:hypothetical protein [Gammaproteobacteria bacterium]